MPGAVRAGIEAQLGVAPERVVCVPDHCDVDVGGAHVGVKVSGARDVAWAADEVVLAAPLVAHIAAELNGLGVAALVDCGPPVQPVPADGRLSCRLEGGGMAWVRLGADDVLELEIALTAEEAAARGDAADVEDLERRSRALDSDEAEGDPGPESDDDDDDGDGGDGDAGVDAPARRGAGG